MYVFVQQSVDGEYGTHTNTLSPTAGTPAAPAAGAALTAGTSSSGSGSGTAKPEFWKGYGIGTTIGLEVMKFVQFVAGHNFVVEHSASDSLESLTGSRLNAGMRLVFDAPVANLELGAGILGSSLNYQKSAEAASFYGSGTYYSLGLNYFTSTRVSFYFEAKLNSEHLVRNGGSASIDAIDTSMTLMGLGFRLWL
jgi:hypothetical protein